VIADDPDFFEVREDEWFIQLVKRLAAKEEETEDHLLHKQYLQEEEERAKKAAALIRSAGINNGSEQIESFYVEE